MTASQLRPYGYETEHGRFQEISEGQHPRVSLAAAPWLPIKEIKTQRDGAFVVMYKGDLVSTYKDTTTPYVNYIVPANGGKATDGTTTYALCPAALKYTTTDVGKTLNQHTGVVVTTADITTLADTQGYVHLPANKPVGYAFTDYYMDLSHLYLNYQLQTVKKPIGCDWYVEWPILNTVQLNATVGDLVIPDPDNIGLWRPLNLSVTNIVNGGGARAELFAAAASGNATITELVNCLHQIVGRVVKVEKIRDIDNLAKETTYPGFTLQGSGTSGIMGHLLNAYTDGSGDQWKVQVQFGAFCS